MSYSRGSRYESRSPYRRSSYSRSVDSSDAENPGNNLYVTGLSARVTDRDLEKHFSTEGEVIDASIVHDPWTRESRGFGFVTMATVKEADRCVKYLDRSVLEGRVITVEKAKRRRGRTPTPGKYLGTKSSRDGGIPQATRLFGGTVTVHDTHLIVNGLILLIVDADHTLRMTGGDQARRMTEGDHTPPAIDGDHTPPTMGAVRSKNKGNKASESDYFTQLIDSFRRMLELVPKDKGGDELAKKLIVDGANGIGGVKLEQIKAELSGLDITVRNSGKEGEGILNHMCGADFVQKERVTPHGFSPEDVGVRCASLDGDADRLVYFRVSSASDIKVDLVDGDKILSLFALFIREQLDIINNNGSQANKSLPARLGIVQTAYANGASTQFLMSNGLEVVFTPTGVKYLHKKALEYDIGIYFEANGHGTVVFSEDFISQLESLSKELSSHDANGSAECLAAMRLMQASQLINQAVGDALSGLLLVEAILQYKGWSFQNWCELYNDLPSRQLKVKVIDRSSIVTTDAETKVSQPSSLQELIDKETANYTHGRCFVRPSGTEDVVRVYAEASTQVEADSLAKSVARHVERLLG